MSVPAQRSNRGLIIGLAALLALQVGGFAAWQTWFRHDSANASAPAPGVIPEMQELTRQRRYDEAAQLGTKSVQGVPGDYKVLQQVALVYLRRAQIEAGDREDAARQAVGFADRALAVNRSDSTNLYDSARVYEIAGDFSAAMKCAYYTRSAELFRQRQPLTEGSSDALKREQEFLSGRIKEKMEKARCP